MEATAETTYCNNCRTDIPNTAWTLHSISCERHRWYCEACKTAFPKNERQKHEEEYHAKVLCECGEEIEICHFTTHKSDECQHRLVQCLYCECPLPFCELAGHEVVCGSRTEPCELCNKRVQLRHLQSHVCEVTPEPSPPPSPSPEPVPTSRPLDDLIICPFCMDPAQDYMMLQEHIFHEHPEVVA